jgi:predicted molibdopterin-dependent oxidoreductase YjgC
MGAHPCIFPGYQNANEPATRRKFEAAWGRPVPSRPGLSALEMISSAAEGRLRLLYAVCGDVIGGAADAGLVRQALRNCDFVVVQGVFESETSRNADVLLPGVTFAEKTGTFTSSERRVQMVRQAIQPQGLSLPDWLIISRIASRILPALETGEFGGWCYSSTAQVMAEIAALTPPYAGISHDRLEKLGSLQWPVKNLSHPGTPMLGLESLSGGRARFTPAKMELEMV